VTGEKGPFSGVIRIPGNTSLRLNKLFSHFFRLSKKARLRFHESYAVFWPEYFPRPSEITPLDVKLAFILLLLPRFKANFASFLGILGKSALKTALPRLVTGPISPKPE
jgi:hypothetical protein